MPALSGRLTPIGFEDRFQSGKIPFQAFGVIVRDVRSEDRQLDCSRCQQSKVFPDNRCILRQQFDYTGTIQGRLLTLERRHYWN